MGILKIDLTTEKKCRTCRFMTCGRCYSNSHVFDVANENGVANEVTPSMNSVMTAPWGTCKHWMKERRKNAV